MAPPSSASLVAALASLAVAAVVLGRPRSPGTRALVVLCGAIVVWHMGDFLAARTEATAWRTLSAIGSAALVPPLVHFVFATLRRRPTRFATALYGVTGLAVVGISIGFFHRDTYELGLAWGWAGFLILLLPPLVASTVLLARAARVERDRGLRLRARRLALGIGIGLGGGLFDAFAMANPGVPRFGAVGTLVGSLLLAWSLDVDTTPGRALATRSALLVVTLTASAALLTIAVSELAEGRTEVVLIAGSGTALAALAAYRVGSARLQRDAMQLQSLALLGTFAAEVAHEVRNPLAAIRGAVQFLREEARRGAMSDDLHSYLELVDEEVERLDAVVTAYHSLARPTAVPIERVDVGKVVHDLVKLHGRVIPSTIEVKVEVDDALPLVRADAGRLRQALLNLVRNAIAAMSSGGTLTLRARADARGRGGPAVLLEVEDTGIGIPRKNLDRILQPHFTTNTGGSGLGLVVTRRIAEEHGGMLVVRSQTGGGSTFTLMLPAEGAE